MRFFTLVSVKPFETAKLKPTCRLRGASSACVAKSSLWDLRAKVELLHTQRSGGGGG